MIKKTILLGLIISMIFMLVACTKGGEETVIKEKEIPYELVKEQEINSNPELRSWIEGVTKFETLEEKNLNDWSYILISMGEKPTGGYGIELSEVVLAERDHQEVVVVKARFDQPKADDFVTQALTYPYMLIKIEKTELPVEFKIERNK